MNLNWLFVMGYGVQIRELKHCIHLLELNSLILNSNPRTLHSVVFHALNFERLELVLKSLFPLLDNYTSSNNNNNNNNTSGLPVNELLTPAAIAQQESLYNPPQLG